MGVSEKAGHQTCKQGGLCVADCIRGPNFFKCRSLSWSKQLDIKEILFARCDLDGLPANCGITPVGEPVIVLAAGVKQSQTMPFAVRLGTTVLTGLQKLLCKFNHNSKAPFIPYISAHKHII